MKIFPVYKKIEKEEDFYYKDSTIELKEYQDDLVFYSPMNDAKRAEFALFDNISKCEQTPRTFTGGKFGSYLRIKSPYSFDVRNFSSHLGGEARISFYLGTNKLNGAQRIALIPKEEMLDEDGKIPAGNYGLTVTCGQYSYPFDFKFTAPVSPITVKNQMLVKTTSQMSISINMAYKAENDYKDAVVIQAKQPGDVLNVSYGTNDGADTTKKSLIDYFKVVNIDYGAFPISDVSVFKLYNFEIKHVENNTNGISSSALKFILHGEEENQENQEILIPWNNDAINMDNIEVDFDENVIYIFINGKLKGIEILKNKFVPTEQGLELGGSAEEYSFDELIINKKCIHTKSFEVSPTQLTKYSRNHPYIDFVFAGSEIKKGMKLVQTACSNIHCCIQDGDKFYYYLAGSWRQCSGDFRESNDWYDFANKIELFDYSGKDIAIRCFFNSNGYDLAYLSNFYFELEDELYSDENGNTSAILIGTREISEPIDNLEGKTLIIKTDCGETTIVFNKDELLQLDEPEVKEPETSDEPEDTEDTEDSETEVEGSDSEGSEDTNTEETPVITWSAKEIESFINSYYPNGISKCYADSKNRMTLISETKGKDASIIVSGSAAPIIFSEVASAFGEDAKAGSVDYKKFYDAVRTYTSKLIISEGEIPNEQMKLFLKEAIAYYKKWRATEANQHTCQLEGNWKDGFEIPAVIESQKDIIDIIFRPIFPITFYAEELCGDSGSENIFALTLAQSLFGGRGAIRNAQGITQDYYISLVSMQDFRQALGLNPSWQILNNRIYIFPTGASRFTKVSVVYKSPLSEEECLNDPDMIKYVHGKCLMTLGNVRGQHGSNLTSGESNLTFNADAMYERGKTFVDDVIKEWKEQQPVLGFKFG